ncbi:MAG: hypothetical protein AAGD25_07075 [Cyanobacteria bacterium P01_F01_bin.150]
MKKLQTLLRRILSDMMELDSKEFIEIVNNLLHGEDKSSVLTAIFLEFQNSNSRSLLTDLFFWFEDIKYQDIIETMLEIGDKDLPAYHFALYVPEIFGVDIIKAASEAQIKYPEAKEKLSFFVKFKKLIGPNKYTMELLKDSGASPERNRESLLETGAPLLPLPGNY